MIAIILFGIVFADNDFELKKFLLKKLIRERKIKWLQMF
jgi:hypothetical protein